MDKYPRPKSGTNDVLIQILKRKMEKEVISSHHTRKNIWLLASGARFAQLSHRGLYDNLIKYPGYPAYYDRQINVDLVRTVPKST